MAVFLEEALRTARSVNHAPFPRVGACQITCTGALAPAVFDHKACQTGVRNEPDIRHLHAIRLRACRPRGFAVKGPLNPVTCLPWYAG
jgi:hypothetical protein